MTIGIIGAGMSGFFTARAMARAGHQVVLLEADNPPPGDVETSFMQWNRTGVAQFRQPHAARSIIVKRLRERDPQLLQAMIDGGMVPWEFHLLGLPHEDGGTHDPELLGLLGRRAALEVPLRNLVLSMPGVRLVRTTVQNLLFSVGSPRRVEGVLTSDGPMRFDSTVDSSGRRSRVADWLGAAGIEPPPAQSNECGIVYYSRNFRFRPGVEVPRGSYPSGPGATMAGVHFTMNRTDARSFTLMLGVTPDQEEFRALRQEAVFMNFASSLPDANLWLAPKISEPIWKVEPFAGLTNRYRPWSRDGRPLVADLYVIGDARFHTNPVHGWGMSFALQMSYMLADAFAAHADPLARLSAFEQQADAYARRYFEASSCEDAARRQLWTDLDFRNRGEPGTYRHYLTSVQPALYKDQVIFRALTRRLHLLDDPAQVLGNQAVQERAARIGASLNQRLSRAQLVQRALEATQAAQASAARATTAAAPAATVEAGA